MLINFNEIFKYNIIPRGVIHLGMHLAEEYEIYRNADVKKIVFIEGNPKLVETCHIKNDDDCLIINATISDKEELVELNIANNGHSSSILKLHEHSRIYPHIEYIDKIAVKTQTLDTICNIFELNLNLFNILNLDIQGHELAAMKGFSRWNNIDAVFTEVNYIEMYKNCSLKIDIDNFMNKIGFTCVQEADTGCGWGDALYIKNK